jgi:hypothetical protein
MTAKGEFNHNTGRFLVGFCLLVWGLSNPAAVEQVGKAIAASNEITALRRAIIGQESGDNFRAVNPHSGALGYGQVMPENVPSWTKEALGRSLSTDEFLNNPDAQLKTIDHKLSQYFKGAIQKANGDEAIAVRRVASAWYSGQGDLWNDTTPQSYNGASYPSISEYTGSVFQKYRAEKSRSGDRPK